MKLCSKRVLGFPQHGSCDVETVGGLVCCGVTEGQREGRKADARREAEIERGWDW